MPLSADQKEAYFDVLQRVNRGKRFTSLTGHAGAGKTFVASRLANALGEDAVVAAPTHKAAWVLDQKVGTEVRTIHSLLNLRMVRDNRTGGYALVQKKKSPIGEGVVLLDESSFVGANLWEHIDEEDDTQWVFIGDPAQLAPVREKPSQALDFEGGHLEEVVRQKEGNPILTLAHKIRRGESYLTGNDHDGAQGVGMTGNDDAFLRNAAERFASADPSQPPSARILAYRNQTVDFYNQRMRHMLYGEDDLPEYMEGDWLMMAKTFFEEDEAQVKNAEEVRVMGTNRGRMFVSGGSWKVWHLHIDRPQTGGKAVIPVLRRSDHERFRKTLRERLARAKKEEVPWTFYYELKEAFARPDYCYAITCHRSQGSTFETAYVDHRDLMRCRNPRERQSLAYVACTRPSTNLALLV